MSRPIDPDLDGFPDTRMATPNELRKMLHDAIRRGAEERTENRRLREWIALAAPVMESACCIAIEENVDRLDEIAGCQGIMETCPIEWERMPHLSLKGQLAPLAELRKALVSVGGEDRARYLQHAINLGHNDPTLPPR